MSGGSVGLSPLKRAALALVLATLIFGRQLASWNTPGNRFLYFWQRSDALPLIAAVLLTAGVLLGVDLAIRRWGGRGVRRISRLAFAFIFVQLLATLFVPSSPERPAVGAVPSAALLAGLVVAGLWRAEATVIRATVTAGLVFAPLPPILFVQMLTWGSWRQCEDRPGPAPKTGARPVFILLFDEWSIHRSLQGNEFRPELRRVRDLARRSFVVREARSPGTVSYKSIPRILFQEPGGLAVRNGWAEWTDDTHAQPLEGRSNLFRLARSHGYRTALSGWYLPFGALVGDDLDRCRAYQQEVKRRGAVRIWDLLWTNLQYFPDPLSRGIWRTMQSRAFSERWAGVFRSIESDALELARHSPDNTVALIHYPLPHAPFIFETDGSYRGPYPRLRLDGSGEDYDRHLRYMDAVLGRFLDALDSAGRLDSSLVVVTADHSWQRDPDPGRRTPEQLQRVPLIIKWPGQRSGSSVPGEICLLSLGKIIDAAIGQGVPVGDAEAMLTSVARPPGAPACGQPG